MQSHLCSHQIKQDKYKEKLRNKLEEVKGDPKLFWGFMKSINSKKQLYFMVTPEKWINHFKSLLNCETEIDQNHKENVCEIVNEHDILCQTCLRNCPIDLNRHFEENEVLMYIKSLKNNKSPGIDGICNEFFKYSVHILLPYYVKLFNCILKSGNFPTCWCKSVIKPLHKSGDVNDPNNFRGISLLSALGKVFTGIINKKLNTWAEKSKEYFEEQAGFRKNRSTIDHIFVAYGLAQKYLCKQGGRYYVFYIDFSKAFDRVSHILLFHRLLNIGIHGDIYKLLRSLYSKIMACIQTDQGLTNFFQCQVGTMQGCMLSPFLFVMFLNQYIHLCQELNCQGIYVNEDFPNVSLLMYADDMIHCSDTVGRLQHQINSLSKFCSLSGMKLNLAKSKIMIFRNGGILKHNENWYFQEQKIETTSYYKYLGLIFSSRLKWTMATKPLAS